MSLTCGSLVTIPRLAGCGRTFRRRAQPRRAPPRPPRPQGARQPLDAAARRSPRFDEGTMTGNLDDTSWVSLVASFGEEMTRRWYGAWKFYYGDWVQTVARAPVTRTLMAEL